jgi:hypothetical protein
VNIAAAQLQQNPDRVGPDQEGRYPDGLGAYLGLEVAPRLAGAASFFDCELRQAIASKLATPERLTASRSVAVDADRIQYSCALAVAQQDCAVCVQDKEAVLEAVEDLSLERNIAREAGAVVAGCC